MSLVRQGSPPRIWWVSGLPCSLSSSMNWIFLPQHIVPDGTLFVTGDQLVVSVSLRLVVVLGRPFYRSRVRGGKKNKEISWGVTDWGGSSVFRSLRKPHQVYRGWTYVFSYFCLSETSPLPSIDRSVKRPAPPTHLGKQLYLLSSYDHTFLLPIAHRVWVWVGTLEKDQLH